MLCSDKSLKNLIFFGLFGDLNTVIERHPSVNALLAENTRRRRTNN